MWPCGFKMLGPYNHYRHLIPSMQIANCKNVGASLTESLG